MPSTKSPRPTPGPLTGQKLKAPEDFTAEDALAALFTVRFPMAPDGEPDPYVPEAPKTAPKAAGKGGLSDPEAAERAEPAEEPDEWDFYSPANPSPRRA